MVERIGVISQYFMASSPNHPFMFIALMQCLYRLVSFVDDIGTQYVPYITGPGVTKAAMMLFMKDTANYETVKAGTYQGIDGSHITVVGSRKKSHRWIIRESISGKRSHYAAMNMTHFNDEKHELKDSCYEHMYKQAIRMREANAR